MVRVNGSSEHFEYWFEIIRLLVTTFQMIAGSSLIFFNACEIKLCSCAAPLKF